jgi:hypothetical protein
MDWKLILRLFSPLANSIRAASTCANDAHRRSKTTLIEYVKQTFSRHNVQTVDGAAARLGLFFLVYTHFFPKQPTHLPVFKIWGEIRFGGIFGGIFGGNFFWGGGGVT